MGVVSYPTLTDVAMESRPYPTELLEGCKTGLVLFAAAFMGHNDAIHFAEAGIRTTCVDIADERMWEMRKLYPRNWSFVTSDAWYFAKAAQDMEAKYDAVSADTFTGDAMYRSLDSLELWTSLANKVVTATVTLKATDSYRTPAGWWGSLYHRANDIYWLVLQRD